MACSMDMTLGAAVRLLGPTRIEPMQLRLRVAGGSHCLLAVPIIVAG